jgi:TolB-like protein
MVSRWKRIQARKIVQWAIAYLAVASVIVGVASDLAQGFVWAGMALRVAVTFLAVGFFGAVIVAWYHGEKGRQHVGRVEGALLFCVFVVATSAAWLVGVRSNDVVPSARSVVAWATGGRRGAYRIGVLPCEQIPANPEVAFLAVGIADQVIAQLTRIASMKPIARTSALESTRTDRRIRRIAAELDVAYILDCAIRSADDRMRITST